MKKSRAIPDKDRINHLTGITFASVSLVFICGVFVMLPYLSPDRRTIMNVVVGVLGATLTSFTAGKMLLRLDGRIQSFRVAVSATAGLAMFVFLLAKPLFADSDTRTPAERQIDSIRGEIADLNGDYVNWSVSAPARDEVDRRAKPLAEEILGIDRGDGHIDRIRQIEKYAMAGCAYEMAAAVAGSGQAELAYAAIDNLSKASAALSSVTDEDTAKWVATSEIADFVNYNLALSARVYKSATGLNDEAEKLTKDAFSHTSPRYFCRAATKNEPYLNDLAAKECQ
jgi:hypothetical protein